MGLYIRALHVFKEQGFFGLVKQTLRFRWLVSILIFYLGGVIPNKSNLVLFGSHRGESYRGNTKAVYEYLLKAETELEPVWMTRKVTIYKSLRSDGKPVIYTPSLRGIVALVRAQVGCFTHQIIDLSGLPGRSISSSTDLVYMTHGRPIKGKPYSKSPQYTNARRDEFIKYVIETSEFQASVKQNATKLSADKFVITGYPRNDILFDSFDGEGYDNFDHVLLYAPTHRRNDQLEMKFFPFPDLETESLIEFIENENILLLLRPHPDVTRGTHVGHEYQSLYTFLLGLTEQTEHIEMASAAEFENINELLPMVDLLITDYSSIFNDFLLLDRPMIFIPYDYELFKTHNGLMYDYYDCIPGAAVATQEEFIEEVQDAFSNDSYQTRRNKILDQMHKYKDGRSSDRVANLIQNITE